MPGSISFQQGIDQRLKFHTPSYLKGETVTQEYLDKGDNARGRLNIIPEREGAYRMTSFTDLRGKTWTSVVLVPK